MKKTSGRILPTVMLMVGYWLTTGYIEPWLRSCYGKEIATDMIMLIMIFTLACVSTPWNIKDRVATTIGLAITIITSFLFFAICKLFIYMGGYKVV